MKALRIAVLSTSIFVLLSCNGQDAKNSGKGINTDSQNQTTKVVEDVENAVYSNTFRLDDFRNVPKELDGCGCYFSSDKKKFDGKEYVFASDNDGVAYISIDKKLVKLKLESPGEKDSFGPGDHRNVYSNDNYKVVVEIKFKKSTAEEVWWNDGTITVESKDGQKITEKLVGECGC